MKKCGQFFFIFVPFLLVNLIQTSAGFFMMGISSLIEMTWYLLFAKGSVSDLYTDLGILWDNPDFNTAIMIIYSLLTIGSFGIWYYTSYQADYRPKPKTVFHPLTIIGILMLVPGMQYMSTYIVSFTASLFPDWLNIYENLMESAGMDDNLSVLMFLYTVVFAPVAEELIFRGVTLRQAEKILPFWSANLLQSFLFGLFHMNMIQGIYAFCLGLILGYICKKSTSIYNAILLHLLFNFWAAALSEFFSIGNTTVSFLFWFIFASFMTAGGLFVFTMGIKKLAPLKANANEI